MCGIISVLSFNDNISDCLMSSLERLEYRGYDSSGIAYISDFKLDRIRSVGKIINLKCIVDTKNINSHIGIGHTRWATHGKVTEKNAHPHVSNGIAIVHNGIIENYQELKKKLLKNGYEFEGETDSEVIAKLISYHIGQGNNFISSFKKALSEFIGAFAIVAIYENEPNILLGAKRGSPMAIGLSSDKKSFYIASDAIALSSLCSNISYLEEGDFVTCEKSDKLDYNIFNEDGDEIKREIVSNKVSLNDVNKNGFETFMLKEIFEEPKVIEDTFNFFNYEIDIKKYKSISIIACGTSYYASLLSKYWIEDLIRIHVDVEIASEFRYRNPVLSEKTLYIFISQSGETIDTLEAMRSIKSAGIKTLAIVNVESSSIARESDYLIKTFAGTEIGVASTKAFIAQVMSIILLCVDKYKIDIKSIISSVNSVLNDQFKLKTLAEKIKDSSSLFYIGRGTSYPVALEGSLKIKELAYISSQGYPSGEIKHGPIALIDEGVYTIALAPNDRYFEKTISNTQEILARNGKVLLITTQNSRSLLSELETNSNVDIFYLQDIEDIYQPFPLTTAVHLLAYYTSKLKGLDVDKPRNLAKSVTVE